MSARAARPVEQEIDGRVYRTDVYRRDRAARPLVSLVMASHDGLALTQVAVDSIRAFCGSEQELWVVDNASTDGTAAYLAAQDDVNVILNHTPAWVDDKALLRRVLRRPGRRGTASYSNAIALELAARHATGRWMFVMHNDVLVLSRAWLPHLLSKVGEQVRGVAMSVDRTRVHAMHNSGFLVDLDLFRELGLTFLPGLPTCDVGDAVTVGLRRAGFGYHVCANTFNRPETVERIPEDDPLRAMYCDRAFDDEWRVIFAHLGRGTQKLAGTYRQPGKTYPEEWIAFGRRRIADAVPR